MTRGGWRKGGQAERERESAIHIVFTSLLMYFGSAGGSVIGPHLHRQYFYNSGLLFSVSKEGSRVKFENLYHLQRQRFRKDKAPQPPMMVVACRERLEWGLGTTLSKGSMPLKVVVSTSGRLFFQSLRFRAISVAYEPFTFWAFGGPTCVTSVWELSFSSHPSPPMNENPSHGQSLRALQTRARAHTHTHTHTHWE